MGGQVGYPLTPDLELNAGLGFTSWNPKAGDGQSGLSDVTVSGRYLLVPDTTRISVGAFATVPVGEDKVRQGNLNFGAFTAFRHPLDDVTVIVGTLGLDFLETKTAELSDKSGTGQDTKVEQKTKYESCFIVGVGIVYAVNDQINVVTELHYRKEDDYLLFSYGADYQMQSGDRLRAALCRGFDAGAPDFRLIVTFLHAF